MKNQFAVLFISVLAFVPCSSQGQGILNGGFELYDARSEFLANWHVREIGSPQTKDLSTTQNGVAGSTVPYRVKPEGFPGVSINPLEGLDEPLSFKEGQNYLHADGWGGVVTVSLSQEALVPEDASNLIFRAQNGYPHYMEVVIDHAVIAYTLKEVIIPEIPSGSVSDWWFDVSAYRGKTVNLDFSILSNVALDRIRFSPESVPEPQMIGLVAFAALLLARIVQSYAWVRM